MDDKAETRILKQLTDRIDDMVVKSHTSKYEAVSKNIGELQKEIKNFRNDMVRDFDRLEDSVKSLESAYRDNILPNVSVWNDMSTSYKDDKKWLTRLIGGAVLMALLGLVLVKNIGV